MDKSHQYLKMEDLANHPLIWGGDFTACQNFICSPFVGRKKIWVKIFPFFKQYCILPHIAYLDMASHIETFHICTFVILHFLCVTFHLAKYLPLINYGLNSLVRIHTREEKSLNHSAFWIPLLKMILNAAFM